MIFATLMGSTTFQVVRSEVNLGERTAASKALVEVPAFNSAPLSMLAHFGQYGSIALLDNLRNNFIAPNSLLNAFELRSAKSSDLQDTINLNSKLNIPASFSADNNWITFYSIRQPYNLQLSIYDLQNKKLTLLPSSKKESHQINPQFSSGNIFWLEVKETKDVKDVKDVKETKETKETKDTEVSLQTASLNSLLNKSLNNSLNNAPTNSPHVTTLASLPKSIRHFAIKDVDSKIQVFFVEGNRLFFFDIVKQTINNQTEEAFSVSAKQEVPMPEYLSQILSKKNALFSSLAYSPWTNELFISLGLTGGVLSYNTKTLTWKQHGYMSTSFRCLNPSLSPEMTGGSL